ncbi:hypothetical protein, partial [Kluyvera intermedia]|uniref:hypothetical protein n=1 Tax=Kluyvera intermedia TaxID=61648 RepID=UPI003709D435
KNAFVVVRRFDVVLEHVNARRRIMTSCYFDVVLSEVTREINIVFYLDPKKDCRVMPMLLI